MTEYLDKLKQIEGLIKKMNLPEHHKSVKNNDNLRWLKSNLQVKNGTHRNYAEVMQIIESMV